MKKLFLLLSFICVCSLSFAQINPQAPMELDKAVKMGKLENGLTYYIRHNQKPAQRADFYIVTNVGAVQETPDQDGLAHFLEHMCLNGSKHFPGKGIISYMESIGCAFGANINASTGFEQTMYMLNNVPVTREGIVDSSLLILFDYSAFVTLDPKEIDAERGVILEEKRTRDNYSWRQMLALRKALFQGSKMENTSIIGSEENLKNFKPESLVNFYKTWYRPDMQAIIVVGDIDVDKVEQKIKDLFGQLPKAENPKQKEPIVVPGNATPIVSIFTDKELTTSGVQIYFKSPAIPAQYKGTGMVFMNELVEDLIGDIINERLSDISRQPDAPFMYASAGYGDLSYDLRAFTGSVASKDGETLKAFNALMVELERVKKYGFTDDEIQRAKTNMLKGYERAMQNAASRQSPALVYPLISHFTEGEPYLDPAYRYEQAQMYLSMIPSQMLSMAATQLYGDKDIVIVHISPEKEGLVTPTKEQILEILANVKKQEIKPMESAVSNEPLMDPSVLKGSPVATTKSGEFGTTVWVLDNGMEIYVKPTDYKKDEVLIKTVALGGKSILPTEVLPSVENNSFSIYQSNAGLGKFSESQLEKMLTGKSVSASPYIGNLEHGVSASSSPNDLETVFQLIYMYYTQPRFEAKDYEVGLKQLQAVLPNMMTNPDFIYQIELQKAVYGDSPRRPSVSLEWLGQLNIESIKKAYTMLMADNAALKVYITGNVNMETLKPLVVKYIGSLPILTKKGTAWEDENISKPKGKVDKELKVKMQTPKTTVGIIYTGTMAKTMENNIKMSLLNGVMDQLYTKTIREDEGGTYGVGVMGAVTGEPKEEFMLLINFDTDVTKAAKLISLAKEGLKGIAQNGPNAEYLAKTKENLIKGFPEKQINNSYWHSLVYNYYSYNRDNHTNYIETVNKVATVESIQKFVQEILSQGNELNLIMNPAQ